MIYQNNFGRNQKIIQLINLAYKQDRLQKGT